MPEFSNPFPGNVPREITESELVRAIMLDIAAEYEAVNLYTAQMDATSNAEAKKVLFDVAQEELVHAGEFTSLLFRIDPLIGAKAQEGFTEVQELLNSKSPYAVTPAAEQAPGGSRPAIRAGGGFTVGSLKDG